MSKITFSDFGEILAGNYADPAEVNGKGLFFSGRSKKAVENFEFAAIGDFVSGNTVPVALLGAEDCIKNIKVITEVAAVAVSFKLHADNLDTDITLVSQTLAAGTTYNLTPSIENLMKTVKDLVADVPVTNPVLYMEATANSTAAGSIYVETETVSPN